MKQEKIRELTLTRTFDAPRTLVWEAWTNPKMIQAWWGPKGVTNPTCVWEAKAQGNINIVMLAGEELGPLKGQEWPMTGTFQEVQEPEKLVYTAHAIISGKPVLETLTTVIFEDESGKTKMIVHIEVTMMTEEAAGPLSGMEMGWNQQLDKLVEFLEKK